MDIETLCQDFIPTHSTLSADTSFVARIPKKTPPTGNGVIELGADGPKTCNALVLLFGGTGDAEGVLDGVRIIGWRRVAKPNAKGKELWIPVKLAEFAGVLGTSVGLAGSPVLNTFRFCDTLTLVSGQGNANVSHELVSPADNTIAHAVVDVKGFQFVEIAFDLGSNMTGAGALYAKI